MLTYIRKNEMNRTILAQIARSQHHLLSPPRLQKNIGKIVIFSVFKEARQLPNLPLRILKWRSLRALTGLARRARAVILRVYSADKIDRLTLIHLRLLMNGKMQNLKIANNELSSTCLFF